LRRRAVELLARREHSRRELAAKLKRLNPDAALVEQVLSRLEAEHAQSDDRFTSEYVRQRSEKGYGPLRIQQELRQRGITLPEALRAALEGIDWFRLAVAVRHKKFGRAVPRAAAERARQTRFLEYRGFAADQIRHALQCVDME
jgi:regulatory protein